MEEHWVSPHSAGFTHVFAPNLLSERVKCMKKIKTTEGSTSKSRHGIPQNFSASFNKIWLNPAENNLEV